MQPHTERNLEMVAEARRIRNKESAKECRKRRRQREAETAHKAHQLWCENAALKAFIDKLVRKIQVYEKHLPKEKWIDDNGHPIFSISNQEDSPASFHPFACVNVTITPRQPREDDGVTAATSSSDQFIGSLLN